MKYIYLAFIGFNSGVDAVVPPEMAPSGEGFPAAGARVGSFPGMSSQVDEEVGRRGEQLRGCEVNVR